MQILDGKRHDKAAQPLHLGHIVTLLNGGKHWGWLSHPETAANYLPEQIELADAFFTKSFRMLVDQWIDSAKDSEGIETPLNRNVVTVPPGYTQPLFDVLLAWLNRGNWPEWGLMRDGKIAISVQPPKEWTKDELGLARFRDPEEYADDCAIFHFKELLDTPGAHRVGRCKNAECRKPYYVRRRLRKAEIKRGTYCDKCVGASSVERTRISREAHKQKLVSLAADSWDEWKPARRVGKQSDWVAKQVNKKLPLSKHVEGKWVSQNREAIETEVKRRKHAKG